MSKQLISSSSFFLSFYTIAASIARLDIAQSSALKPNASFLQLVTESYSLHGELYSLESVCCPLKSHLFYNGAAHSDHVCSGNIDARVNFLVCLYRALI